jgi:hypothetical protein
MASGGCGPSQPGRYESTTRVDEECLRGAANSCSLVESSSWKRRAGTTDHGIVLSSCLSCATCRLLYLSLELKTEERDQCHAYRPRCSAATLFLRLCTFRFGDAPWLAVTASSSFTAAKGTASTSIRTSLLVLLHSINSLRRFKNGWRSTQNDDLAGHPIESVSPWRGGVSECLGGVRRLLCLIGLRRRAAGQ